MIGMVGSFGGLGGSRGVLEGLWRTSNESRIARSSIHDWNGGVCWGSWGFSGCFGGALEDFKRIMNSKVLHS